MIDTRVKKKLTSVVSMSDVKHPRLYKSVR